jgi:hypothetical protein
VCFDKRKGEEEVARSFSRAVWIADLSSLSVLSLSLLCSRARTALALVFYSSLNFKKAAKK